MVKLMVSIPRDSPIMDAWKPAVSSSEIDAGQFLSALTIADALIGRGGAGSDKNAARWAQGVDMAIYKYGEVPVAQLS